MELERAKELCQYLQTELRLAPSFCEVLQNDANFAVNLYKGLKPHYEELQDALSSAFLDSDGLKGPVERELYVSFGEIPAAKTYMDTVLNVIKWAESEGWLLELIAAAYKRRSSNPLLRQFVMVVLKQLIEQIIPPAQVAAQVQPIQSYPTTSANGNDIRGNVNGALIDGSGAGTNGNGIEHPKPTIIDTTLVHLEPGKVASPRQTIPFPRRLILEDKQPSKNPLTHAYELTHTAWDAILLTYDMFESNEQLSEDDAIYQVNEAKGKVEQISSVVEHIPVPDYPDLHYRLIGEQEYFCEKAGIAVLSIQKIKNRMPPPQFLQTIKEGLEALLQSLQQTENLIGTFARQVEQLNRRNDTLLGSGS